MDYRADQLGKIIGAKLLNAVLIDEMIQHVVFDSRRVDFPDRSIFFAFERSRNDGHQFIGDLYALGVRHFVISKKVLISNFPNANFFLVETPLKALQTFALYHRQKFNLPVIGITGSNGKTIIKEWLFQLLEPDFNIIRSPLSFNSQIGVPLSVLQINKEHNLGIFEAGISKPNEMKNLAPIIDCSIGIFTNIGQAHNEGFVDSSEKIKEKLKLFSSANLLIYCKDQIPVSENVVRSAYKKTLCWSKSQSADLQIISEKTIQSGNHQITALYQQQKIQISIPFSDTASVENAIHCWLTLLHLGLAPEVIKQRMATLSTIEMRLEMKAGINGSTLINDSYNSDLTSLSVAINFLKQQGGHSDRTVIISDILQSGFTPEILYQKVAQILADQSIKKLIGIGKEVQLLSKFSKIPSLKFYPDTPTFLKEFDPEEFQQEIILLKGARRFEFEKIARYFARKNHNTSLDVDLNALTHNLNIFRKHLNPKTQLMVMVKAAAYGSGSDEVARLLQFQQVDYLAVAYADEGVELRKAGIHLPIMVLNPEEATFDKMLRHQLEPEIYSLHLLGSFLKNLDDSQYIKIHLKLDTGMHRLGFEQKDIAELGQILKQNPQVHIASIFSHLSASDEVKHDDFTQAQFKTFQDLYEKIATLIGYRPQQHILNSNGIIRFPQYQMDMVRLGIGLYGIGISVLPLENLETVLSLKASISQIKTVSKGETIGYSRKGKAESNLRIATISIGYADGLLRKAGNGRYTVLIRGKAAPTIGNICMDMTMVDITHIPEASEGDTVVIFGKEHPVERLASCYESLVYEVFTGISERVKRVYFQE